jgi:hypothetical protein
MNNEWVAFHLKEASDELLNLITAAENSSMSEEEFQIGITHTYHHLNTAWNSRSISDNVAREHSDWDFVQWRQFPNELI